MTLQVLLAATFLLWGANSAVAQNWRGLRVAPESRCSPYQASDYSYPQSVEVRIIESLGAIWSPYTGRTFTNRRETDIELAAFGRSLSRSFGSADGQGQTNYLCALYG